MVCINVLKKELEARASRHASNSRAIDPRLLGVSLMKAVQTWAFNRRVRHYLLCSSPPPYDFNRRVVH